MKLAITIVIVVVIVGVVARFKISQVDAKQAVVARNGNSIYMVATKKTPFISQYVISSASVILDCVLVKDLVKYIGQKVKLKGRVLGWVSGYGSPPISRSDWVFRDETGGVYVTGLSLQDRDVVEGVVEVKNGVPYIRAIKP